MNTLNSFFALTSVIVSVVLGFGNQGPVDSNVHPFTLVEPATLSPGGHGTATVSVTPTPVDDTVVSLSSTDTTQMTVPSTVTVLAGHSSANFTISATASASKTAEAKATCNGVEVTGNTTTF